MLATLENWIKSFGDEGASLPHGADEWAKTIAGLLVEAAMADGVLDDAERVSISEILIDQLDLDQSTVDKLIEAALADHDERVEIHSLTRKIRSDTDMEERITIMEMVWMVVLADGEKHDHEAQLMRRLAGLLFVDDQDSARAAQRAKARLESQS
ncbi:MAG: TerB family tellurite resistance protein [Alphaproteobacteria bacterium]